MEKSGKKTRDIRFYSEKNKALITIHSREARDYAKLLEADERVASYSAGRKLDEGRLQMIPRLGIRGVYFEQTWETDFYILGKDGSVSVRELIRSASELKRADAEKLELSRRYWHHAGVSDWKVVEV